jgi:TRAP-type C4-dicarboxylate transport system substrate-binding protein
MSGAHVGTRVAAAATLAVLLLSLIPPAEGRTLLFADFGANRGPRAAALQWFADELRRRSKGSLEVRFHWGGSLLGANAMLQGVADGVADLGSITAFSWPRTLRGYNIGDLPVDNADIWVGMRAMYELATTHPELAAEFERAGVAYVTNYSTGPIQLICTRGLGGLAELQGTRLRGSGPYAQILAELGARVQRMSQPDVYQALASGLLDCNQNYYYGMLAYRQYEVAAHVLELDWGQNLAFGIVMSRRTRASLSAEEQRILAGVGSDFIDHFAQRMLAADAEARSAMSAGIGRARITVAKLPAAEQAQLQVAGDRHVGRWLAEATADGRDGAGILAAYRQHLAGYTRERDAGGYPWTR